MPIALTSDQADLAAAVAGFTARHADIAATRAAFDKIASGEPQPSWQALVDQRLHALHLPEWAGGDGGSLVELAVVLEQAAFGLLPGPLLPTVVASQLISARAPRALAHRLLPALASGATAAMALAPSGLRGTRTAGGWRVTGQSAPVLGAASAQILILGAETDDAVHGGDRLLPATTDQVRDMAAALFAAEAAGVARWCQQAGLAYAKVREQFGVTIGSFQAVKHKCARLYARTELLTAAAWDAAVAGQDDEGQFALAAAVAAVLGPPSAVGIALDTITVLGGIGYTWEHDVHLYWRRAMSLAALLGPAGTWRKRLTSLSRVTGRHHDLPLVDEPAGLRAAVAPVLAEARASPTLASGAVSWPPAASRPRTTRTRTASAPARPPRS